MNRTELKQPNSHKTMNEQWNTNSSNTNFAGGGGMQTKTKQKIEQKKKENSKDIKEN